MERFLLIAAVAALAVAKPEIYREKEDFQYSRSSSDEGSKSGFYGAQRGNMGGNFERAHNMDGLAQHQMSGLVRQVQGELGDGSKTRTGSVFTAANSKGIYGSGNYDLSNLEGRNFQEGVSVDDSQSLSSLSSHARYNNVQSSASSNSGAYSTSDSQSSRYHTGFNGYSGQSSLHSGHTYDNSGQSQGYTGQVGNLQELDSTRGVRRYDYGGQEASGHYSQSGYHGQSAYDQSNTNSHSSSDYGVNTQNRHFTATPVRVVIRPGTKVAVPVATQNLNTAHTGLTYDQNSVNSEAEMLNNQNHHNVYKPTGQAKHYESAYSYHKEWEKHDTKPVVVPTENPFPKNSELYEDSQAHLSGQQYVATAVDSQNSHLNSGYSGYNTNMKSASSNLYRHQFNSNEEQNKAASSLSSNSNTYTGYNAGLNTDVNNQIEDANNKPKSYQSAYSYHKSWERQGDPYIIKPATTVNGAQESQKLTAASENQGTWSSHQYGSRVQKNRQYYANAEDCDHEQNSHIRVARSYNANQHQQAVHYEPEETGQQTQNLGQQAQNKWENLEDLGQQAQNKWNKLEETGQQTDNQWGNLETLGQQTQDQWDKVNGPGQQTQNQWDKLEDLGQQTQNQWNNFPEQARPEAVEQETQNSWIDQLNSAVQTDANKQTLNQSEITMTHDLNQQTQNTWSAQSEIPVIHNLNQQTQNTFIGQSDTEVEIDRNPLSTWNINKPSNQDIAGILVPHVYHHNTEVNKPNILSTSSLTVTNDNKPETVDTKILEDTTKPKENFASDHFNVHFNNGNFLPPSGHIIPGFNNYVSQLDNSFYPQFGNTQPWGNEQQHTYFNQHSQTYSNNWNSYEHYHKQTGWPNQINSKHTEEDVNNQNAHSTPALHKLNSLWDKIDSIEKQFSSDNESQVNLTNTQTEHVDTNQYAREYFPNNPYGSLDVDHWHSIASEEETSHSNSNNDKIFTTDVGRGDIGSDEHLDQITTSTEKILKGPGNQYTTNSLQTEPEYKPHKTQAEIEILSQTLGTNRIQNQQQTDSFVTITSEQKSQDTILKLTSTSSPRISTSNDAIIPELHTTKVNDEQTGNTSKKQITSEDNTGYSFGNLGELGSGQPPERNLEHFPDQANIVQPFQVSQQQSRSLKPHNTEQFQNFGQQNSNLDQQFDHIEEQKPTLEQQNTGQFKNTDQQSSTTEQKNTEQQFEIFGQQNQPLEQHNTEQSEKFGQQKPNLKQQNTEQQFENFGHQNHNLEQQNTEQQFENFGHQIPNLEQQNTEQQFENVGHQKPNLEQQNTEQQFDNFEQQSSTLEQQNTEQQFDIFEQQSQPLEHQNTEQQFDNFDQQSQPLEQQNTEQQFDNFDQQSQPLEQQNTEQQFENFDQEKPNLEQQNTEQQFDNFDLQSSSLEQQNTEQQFKNFGQHNENLDQQNINEHVDGYGKQSENLNQQQTVKQLENFGTNNKIQEPVQIAKQVNNLEILPPDELKHKTHNEEQKYPGNGNEQSFETEKSSINNTDIPPEVTTEKSGFWSNVGNKFVNAKNKVFSWFQGS